ncbi:MAG: PEP-CTERM sorting domain-containing protein [Planctomycetia bacterium]|nr:PEP-CTERM sorting domain-containing protein [Planctomycetia bacterium]
MTRNLKFAGCLLCWLLCVECWGADVYSTGSQGLQTPPLDWNTGSYWDDGKSPSSENDYYITKGHIIRTPQNTSTDSGVNTFAGNRLQLGDATTAGTLVFKSHRATLNNLVFVNGTISNGVNAQVYVYGEFTVNGSGGISSAADPQSPDNRSMFIAAKITGSGTLSTSASTGTGNKVAFLNPNNTFSGTLNVNGTLSLYDGTSEGILGSDTVKVVTAKGATIQTKSNIDIGTWNTTYYSATGDKAFLMPSTITVSDANTQAALKVAGISAEIGNVITSTASTRAPATYYSNQQGQQQNSWDDVNVWSIGSSSGTVSTVVPTVGDTVHIVHTFRTSNTNDSTGVVQNFLAKTYIDANGGWLSLKNGKATVNIPDLILNGGKISNGLNPNTTNKLDGNIVVAADSSIETDFNRSVQILSKISGSANLGIVNITSGTMATQAGTILSGNNSAYTGAITVNEDAWLSATADNALGSGTLNATKNSLTQIAGEQSLRAVNVSDTATVELAATGSLTAEKIVVGAGSPKFTGTGTITTQHLDLNPGTSYTPNAFQGTVSFANGFTADRLTLKSVGVTVTGGDVVIGKSDLSTSLWVPTVGQIYSIASGAAYYNVALDFSDAESSTIQVDHFEICTSTSGPNVIPKVTVRLAPESIVKANTLSIASSNATGLGVDTSENTLYLGETSTTIAVDTLHIGGGNYYNESGTLQTGAKGWGSLKALEGGKLILTGTDGVRRANMKVGWAAVSTGGGSKGVVDLSGITDDSLVLLDKLVVAQQSESVTFTQGTFTMDAGTVDVNSLVLAQIDQSATGKCTATFNLNGGTLKVGEVRRGTAKGNEVVHFNFTDGTLDVGVWGTEAIPLELVQDGGTLTTSGSTLTLFGDYTQNAGTLQLDLGEQKLVAKGTVDIQALQLDAADGFVLDPVAVYEVFDLSDTTGFDWSAIDISGVGALAGYDLVAQLAGNVLFAGTRGAISAAFPEPSSWMILLLGMLGLIWKRRNR